MLEKIVGTLVIWNHRVMSCSPSVTPSLVSVAKVKGMTKHKSFAKRSDYIESSTLHGLNHAFTSKLRSERYFWLAVLFVSLLALTVGFSVMISNYYNYEVDLEVTTVYDELEFPSVTFCNNKRMSKLYIPDNTIKFKDLETAFSENFYEYASKYPGFCSSNGVYCNLTEDFTTYGYGDPCVTWNMNAIYNQKLPGFYNGASFKMYVDADSRTNNSFYGTANTITVVIHHKNEYPSYYFDNVEIGVGDTRIALYKKHYTRLSQPYPSACTEITSLLETKDHFSYSRNSCFEACLVKFVLEKCGDVLQPRYRVLVSDWMYSKYKKNQTSNEYYKCYANIYVTFYYQGLKICDCPLACHEVVYNQRIQTVPLDHHIHYNYISEHNFTLGSSEHFKKSFYMLTIYYPRLEFERSVENAAYQLSDVFYDLGGLLGLTIGASVISMVEIIVICLLSISSKLKKKPKQSLWKRKDRQYFSVKQFFDN